MAKKTSKKRKGKSRAAKTPRDEGHAAPADDTFSDEDAVATLAVDKDGYLVAPEGVDENAAVVVADFDPHNPGQELAEPQKVLVTSNDRRARKAEQRKNLEK